MVVQKLNDSSSEAECCGDGAPLPFGQFRKAVSAFGVVTAGLLHVGSPFRGLTFLSAATNEKSSPDLCQIGERHTFAFPVPAPLYMIISFIRCRIGDSLPNESV